MPTIDPTKISPEITDKYSIVSNAFKLDKIVNPEKDLYTNEPKDEINVIIGDNKVPDNFLPQIKLERWSNETNFSVRLKVTEYEKATVTTDKDKIIWDKDNIKIEFFDYAEGEGGHKMIWYLKEKPLTNKVEFTIQSKGLDFFYQPELTQQEIDEGASRPENVVGSYAVYHQTKGGMNDINGKEYKIGKAFHIYRPHIIDAEGKETWGNLHIENGIYSVEIPQEFLDKAVYPIKSNDNFGYEGAGTTSVSLSVYGPYRCAATSGASAGTGNSITAKISNDNTTTDGQYKFTIYSGNNILANGTTNTGDIAHSTSKTTLSQNFISSPTIQASTSYFLAAAGTHSDSAAYISTYWDSTTGVDSGRDHNASFGFNDPWTEDGSSTTRNYTIYATYTPAGGGGWAS